MKKIHLLTFLSLFFLIGCKKDKTPPNVILIITDDQGYGDLNFNGNPNIKTPALDKFANESVRFNNFYVSPVCAPTRSSLMTGRYSLRTGVRDTYNGGAIMASSEVTLAEMLKQANFTTGIFGKWHLGTLTKDILDANRGGKKENDIHYAPPWDNGFDVSFVTESKVPTWDPMITPPNTAEDVKATLSEGAPFGTYYWKGAGQPVTKNISGDDSRVIMDRVIPFIEESVAQNQPFLSIIWFHAPHLPVLTGDQYKSVYADLSEDKQNYYGVISALDEQVGRLRDQLKSLGLAHNTLIFYTSDNGPETSKEVRGQNIPHGRAQGITKGLRGRKRSLLEGGIRVPVIFEWTAKIPSGTRVEVPCFTSDYFPTIAHILGIDIKKYQRPYDGENLMPYWNKKKQKRSKPLAFQYNNQFALIDNDIKLYNFSHTGLQLFDLGKDAGEENDLSSLQPERLKALQSVYRDWNLSVQNSDAGGDY